MVRNAEPELRTRMVTLPAHVSQNSLAALDRQIEQAILSKPEAISLGMTALQTIDSASLNWLLSVQHRLAAQGIQMLIQNPSAVAADIFVATRLDHRFKMVATGATE